MTEQTEKNIATIGEAIGEWLVDVAARHLPPDIKERATSEFFDRIKERTTEELNDRDAKQMESQNWINFTVIGEAAAVDGWELQEIGCWKCNELCEGAVQFENRVYGWCTTHQPIFIAHVEDKEDLEANSFEGQSVDISSWFRSMVFQQDPRFKGDPAVIEPVPEVVTTDASFIWRLTPTESGFAITTGTESEPDLVAEYPPEQEDLAQMLVTAHNVAMAGERQRFHDLVYVQQQENLAKIDQKLDEVNARRWVSEASGPSVKVMDTTGELIVQLTGAHKAMAERLVNKHNADVGLDKDG